MNEAPRIPIQGMPTGAEFCKFCLGQARQHQAVGHVHTELVAAEPARSVTVQPGDKAILPDRHFGIRHDGSPGHAAVDQLVATPDCIDPSRGARHVRIGPVGKPIEARKARRASCVSFGIANYCSGPKDKSASAERRAVPARPQIRAVSYATELDSCTGAHLSMPRCRAVSSTASRRRAKSSASQDMTPRSR